MPPECRARACFDLGNATLQQADGDPRNWPLRSPPIARCCNWPRRNRVAHRCTAQSGIGAMLGLKARANETKEKVGSPKKPDKTKPKEDGKSSKKSSSVFVPVDPTDGFKPQKLDKLPGGRKSDNAQPGSVVVIPDTEKVFPLCARKNLGHACRSRPPHRRTARRQQRQLMGPGQLSTKDW